MSEKYTDRLGGIIAEDVGAPEIRSSSFSMIFGRKRPPRDNKAESAAAKKKKG